jgi:hypothetical protein
MLTYLNITFTQDQILYRGKESISGEELKKSHNIIVKEITHHCDDNWELTRQMLCGLRNIDTIMDSLANGQNSKFDIRNRFDDRCYIQTVVEFIMNLKKRTGQ